jgi:hypothetical protein
MITCRLPSVVAECRLWSPAMVGGEGEAERDLAGLVVPRVSSVI